ncbi:hypothetical protein ACFX13_032792 [Malus domestica]
MVMVRYSLQLDMATMAGKDFCKYWQELYGRFHDNERREKLLQEYVFVMWRIWKRRNEMVFNGVLVKPMEMVNLVRRHLLEFRAGQCKQEE